MRRAGSRYAAGVHDHTQRSRLRRFEFSTEQAYMLELAAGRIKFFRHQSQIMANDVGCSIENGEFEINSAGWDDLSDPGEMFNHDGANQELDLRWAGTTGSTIAQQDVATSSTSVEHCLRFRVKGPAGGFLHVRIGSASGLDDFYADTIHEVGNHCIAFTPSASPFYLQFRRQSDQQSNTLSIDRVAIIDDAPVEIISPWAEADLPSLEGPQSADVLYLYHPDYLTRKLQRFGHSSWSLVDVPWVDGPWLGQPSRNVPILRSLTTSAGNVGGTTLIDTDRTEDDDSWIGRVIHQVTGANAGESRIITDFVKSTATFTVGPAFSNQVASGVTYEIWPRTGLTTMTPSATSGDVTITASSAVDINGGRGFLSTDVGRLIRLSNPITGTDWGFGRITRRVTALSVTARVLPEFVERAFASTAPTAEWRLGAWSNTTGWPRNGAFYEQRMFACNTETQPQTFWASNTGDFENMAPDSENVSGQWDGTVEDDDGLDYTLSSDDVCAIFWMSPGENTLVLGTSGGQWVPESQGAVLTPSDIVVRRQTSHKCAPIQPVRIDSVVLFVQRAKRKIREFGFAFEIDGYRAPDMTRLAQHVAKGGIVEMAYQEEPDSLVWAVRGDGQLLSMTYRREEDVVGWSRHIFGGSFGEGDAVVESVATIPGDDGPTQVENSEDRDEVWVIVKRTINGSTVRYIEVLEGDWETGDEQERAYYADSCITYDGAPATVITGLDHLEGETVKVLADGAIVDDAVVSGGQITLDEQASVVQIGLGFTHKLKTLKIEGGTAAGTAVGKTKKIAGLTFVLLNAHRIKFGPASTQLFAGDFRLVSDLMDTAAAYFTGEYFKEFEGDWMADPRVHIEDDAPVPFTLLAMAPEIAINEVK